MTFFVLVCRQCGGDPDGNPPTLKNMLPMPFSSPAERGHWASEHTKATGHDSWLVLDQPEQPAEAAG